MGALLLLPLLGAGPAQAIPRNSCKVPYWEHSLRCQYSQPQVPQPNLRDEPATPDEVKDFTRVFLNRTGRVRSVDGTRPIIYVDKAICTRQGGCRRAAEGEPINTNRWLISMTGGDACHVGATFGTNTFDDPTRCLDFYATQSEEMGTAFEPPMKQLDGINRPDPGDNPAFASFNRVRVEKSSFDRYVGRAAYQQAGGEFQATHDGRTISFNLYQQGFLHMAETLLALENGLAYRTWAVENGEVVRARERLPRLRGRDGMVVFLGHSAAAIGLHHNIDHLTELLDNQILWRGEVRAVFDANFLPGIESEVAFGSAQDAYDHVWQGTSSAGGSTFRYRGSTHYTTGYNANDEHAEIYRSWRARPDESCVAEHPTEAWMCLDRGHLKLNHISTPYFVREDFTDPNSEHTAFGNGHDPPWGEWDSYPYCPAQLNPCPPRFTLAEHRQRLEEQADTLITQSATRSEFVTPNGDPTSGGNFPLFYVWMPDCGAHGGAYDEVQFFNRTMSFRGRAFTMNDFLEMFVRAPASGPSRWLVDERVEGGDVMETDPPCRQP